MKTVRSSWLPITLGIIILLVIIGQLLSRTDSGTYNLSQNIFPTGNEWTPPDSAAIPSTPEGDRIRYGRELITNTAYYLGPKGIVATRANGMNCQNCHLAAGTKAFSNPFYSVASTYPRYRDRSGRLESIEFRVNDCMERSMNGQKIDSLSEEMQAMVAYLRWVGKDLPKGAKPLGAGVEDLPYLSRPADPAKGQVIYEQRCQRCHGTSGQGLPKEDGSGYTYPPLWGPHSYNTGAGLYRLSRLAGFIKSSMPFDSAALGYGVSAEEAWDVGAFIAAQPRPVRTFPYDWPNKAKKPADFPFGPYTDSFTEAQHKYGPFGPIQEAKEKKP